MIEGFFWKWNLIVFFYIHVWNHSWNFLRDDIRRHVYNIQERVYITETFKQKKYEEF